MIYETNSILQGGSRHSELALHLTRMGAKDQKDFDMFHMLT